MGREISIRAKANTSFVILSDNDKEGAVLKDRRIPGCKLLQDLESSLVIDSPLGTWLLVKDDWVIEQDEKVERPYKEEDGFRYVEGCPYFYLPLEKEHDHRKGLLYSTASCLLGLNIGPINCLDDYLEAVYKHGTGTWKAHNREGLSEIGVGCTVSHTIGPEEIEDEINEGRPVVIAVVAKGTYRKPFGLTYYVCIYGYSKDSWLLHDPCGRLDLKDGLWESTLEGSGKGVKYDRALSDKRIFYGGGASGWGYLRFNEL